MTKLKLQKSKSRRTLEHMSILLCIFLAHKTVSVRLLSTFVGDCIVAASELAQNAKALEAWTVFQKYKACGRILFKFEETRQGIAEEVVELLVKEKFVLIGTSSPSIDDEKSHDFPNHRFALSHGLCALENLVLDKVEPGAYFLSAAPIKWLKAEASPVRAYLIKK